MAQPLVSQVHATQPISQQQSPPTDANVVTIQVGAGDQTISAKKSRLKYLVYSLLGLVLSVLGLLIEVIWIIAKEQQAKMRKIVALLVGVTLSVVVWFVVADGITIGEPTLETVPAGTSQAVKQVEMEIVTDLVNLYPNRSFRVIYGEHNPPFTIGKTTISTFIAVELSADEKPVPEEIVAVGNQVCTTLRRLQLVVSQIQIETVSTKAIFSSSQGIGGTCEEYSSGEILNTLQSL